MRLRSPSRLSMPKAIAAAVGSSMIFLTVTPAICAASRVAARCASPKCAGTVITACVTSSLRLREASLTSLPRIALETSAGVVVRPPKTTWARGSSSLPGTIP